jgi:hypothetical protein
MTLRIDTVQAEPGQKSSGFVHVDLGIAAVRLPIVLINGARPGPRLAITAAIHHGEFIGIEALRSVVSDLDPAQLSGQIVACPLSNPAAFYSQRGPISPLDEINLNRVFPGDPNGRPTERLAHWLYQNLLSDADAYIDLHGGGPTEGLSPFVAYRSSGDEALDQRTVALAVSFGWENVIRGPSAGGGNTHAATTRDGIPSLLIETGSQATRSPNNIQNLRQGLLSAMEHLGMLAQSASRAPADAQHWIWDGEVEATLEGLWYPDIKIGDDVQAGSRLGRILDPLGNELADVRAPVDGRAFYGEAGLVAAAGIVLAAIAVPEEDPTK